MTARNLSPIHQRQIRWSLAGLPVLLFSLAFTASCNTVEFYEMQAHTSNVMQYDSSTAKSHLEQKVRYSMEGSAGGIGSSAGGGCGCY